MRPVFGEKIVPRPAGHRHDADNIWGPAWHAWRDDAGQHLEYATGDLAGNDRRFAISVEEFDRLRADPAAFDPIIHAHGG